MKRKNIRLISGKEENGRWVINCVIQSNEKIVYGRAIRIITKEEDRISNKKRKNYQHTYYEKYKEKRKESRKENYEISRKREKINLKKYRNSEQGKVIQRKVASKRRKLGFNIIATFKKDKILSPTCFHHINNYDMIEVPEWLHRKCSRRDREEHRILFKSNFYLFLTEEYYNVINKEKFEAYKNV